MSSEEFHEELDGIHPGFWGFWQGLCWIPLSRGILGSCHKGARPDLVWHLDLSLLRCWDGRDVRNRQIPGFPSTWLEVSLFQ